MLISHADFLQLLIYEVHVDKLHDLCICSKNKAAHQENISMQ